MKREYGRHYAAADQRGLSILELEHFLNLMRHDLRKYEIDYKTVRISMRAIPLPDGIHMHQIVYWHAVKEVPDGPDGAVPAEEPEAEEAGRG